MIKKFFKGIIIFILVVVVLLVGAFLALPHIVPLEGARARLESTLNEAVNGSVVLQDVKLSTFPWLGVRVVGLEVKNGKVFQESTLFKIAEAGVRIKVVPLLSGKIVGEIRVEKPIIRMEKLADGQSSLALISKKKEGAAEKPAPPPAAQPKGKMDAWVQGMLATMQLESFVLEGGELRSISYDAERKPVGKGLDIQQLSLRLEDLTPHGQVPVKLKAAVFNPYKPDVDFDGLLQTDLDLAQLSAGKGTQRLTLSSGSLHVGDIVVQVSGEFQQRAPEPLYVDVKAHSTGIALGRLGSDLPPLAATLPKDLVGDLSFSTHAVGHLGENAPKPLRIELESQSKLITLDSGKRMKAENTRLTSIMVSDVVTLESMSSDVFDGKLNMGGTVSLKDKRGPQLDMRMDLNKVNLATLNATFKPEQELIDGSADLSVHATGLMTPEPKLSGDQKGPLAPSWLTSKGNLKIGPGKLKTMNLMNDLMKVLVELAPVSPELKKDLSRVEWRSANMDFRTADGRVFVEPMVMDYGSAKVRLKGQIDPKQNFEQFGGEITLPPETAKQISLGLPGLSAKDGSMKFPVRITGTVGRPVPFIDLKRVVKDQVVGEAKKVLEKEGQKVLKDLLGGPPPKKKDRQSTQR